MKNWWHVAGVWTGGSCLGWLAAMLCVVTTGAVAAPPEPIVIGQSLPNGMGSYRSTVALRQSARALVGLANANGGVQGRPIKLVSLDGGNDPKAHAQNVRDLVKEHGAVLILGCGGDAVCAATAQAAAEMKVPLVGALSGGQAVSRLVNRWAYTVRPGYDKEAAALSQQLKSLGITRVAVLTDAGATGEKAGALRRATEVSGIQVRVLAWSPGDERALDGVLGQIALGNFQAVAVDVAPDSIDALASREAALRAQWPRFVVSLASSSLQGLGNLFPDRAIGFSQVAPNPDADSMPLTVEFQRSAEQYSASTAINFDGMSLYLAGKVALAALRRAGPTVDGASVAAALDGLDRLDLGGYFVSFGPGRETASDWVRIGMRSRNGTYLK
jgi:branched-chain amino acid transport system substrate-binding protein